MGQSYNEDANYLFLRGRVFYINKLYYAAIDALLIALEFEQHDKIYNLLAEIYGVLGNKDLEKSIANPDLRIKAINILKDQLTGIYRK